MADHYIVNVEAVILDGDRYLMIVRGDDESHAPGTLSVPGGKVEGVDVIANVLEETARREVREEVAIEVEEGLDYIESKFFVTDDGDPVIDVVFLCRYRSGEPKIVDRSEVSELAWLTAREVISHEKTPPWTRSSIEMAEQRRVELGW